MKGFGWFGLLLLTLSPDRVLAASSPDFWLAERGEQKLWLLGSIHVGHNDMYPLPPAIMQRWQQADNLIVETDLNQSDPSSQQSLLSYAMLPTDTTLSQQLSLPLYQKTIQTAALYQLSEPLLSKFRPWFVAITLQQQAIQQAGYQAALGVDQYFIGLAKDKLVSIHYLETPDQQLAYLAGLGGVENDFLEATLKQIHKVNDDLPDLIKAWEKGDRNKIQALLEDDDTSPELRQYLEQHLIQERNQNWLPKIMSQTYQRNFMVVGAMHLYGPNGLIQMLKQNGYKLSNIQTR
ncbi:MAG: TraB/GumN family protein [Tolumonas sp.]|nr:TraB/GumN family protein [Tolumonas sp.]